MTLKSITFFSWNALLLTVRLNHLGTALFFIVADIDKRKEVQSLQ